MQLLQLGIMFEQIVHIFRLLGELFKKEIESHLLQSESVHKMQLDICVHYEHFITLSLPNIKP